MKRNDFSDPLWMYHINPLWIDILIWSVLPLGLLDGFILFLISKGN